MLDLSILPLSEINKHDNRIKKDLLKTNELRLQERVFKFEIEEVKGGSLFRYENNFDSIVVFINILSHIITSGGEEELRVIKEISAMMILTKFEFTDSTVERFWERFNRNQINREISLI